MYDESEYEMDEDDIAEQDDAVDSYNESMSND